MIADYNYYVVNTYLIQLIFLSNTMPAKRRTKDDIVRIEMIGDHKIPFYNLVTVDNLHLEVPKHVKRICSLKNGRISYSGWQIANVRKDVGAYNPFF